MNQERTEIVNFTPNNNAQELLLRLSCCVIIPTYNNSTTVENVVRNVLCQCRDVFVVNDGSTDETQKILQKFAEEITILSYHNNMGKTFALKKGFDEALKRGFKYAVTIDSDGQHRTDEIVNFANEVIKFNQPVMLIGSRSLNQENMPGKNTFANKFSNFWFGLQTLQILPDTQSGFRLYPIKEVSGMRVFGNRYEGELEMMVRLCWKGVKISSVPISVYYAPKNERVTHFRPGKDFIRISILNTILNFLAVIYGYPSMLLNYLKRLYIKQ